MEQINALLPGLADFLEVQLASESLSAQAEARRHELCDLLDLLRLGDGPPVPVDRGKTEEMSPATSLSLPSRLRKHVSFDQLGTISDSDSGSVIDHDDEEEEEDDDEEDFSDDVDDLPPLPPPPPPRLSNLQLCADQLVDEDIENGEPGYETSTNLMAQVMAKKAAKLVEDPDYETSRNVLSPKQIALPLPRCSSAGGLCTTEVEVEAEQEGDGQDETDDCIMPDFKRRPQGDLQLPTKALSPSRLFSTASCLEQSSWTLVGPLSHRCKGLKWQRLGWCMLTGCRLLGHKSYHSMSPAVSIFLAGYRAIYVDKDSGASHVIKLMCPSGDREAHVLAADTEEQARLWVEQINNIGNGQTPTLCRNFMQEEQELQADLQEDSGFSAPLSSSSDGSGDGVIGKTSNHTLAAAAAPAPAPPASSAGRRSAPVYMNGSSTPAAASTLPSTSIKYSDMHDTYMHLRTASGGLISNVRRKVESLGNSARRKASRRAVVSMTAELCAATATDALNQGVAWVRTPEDKSSWTEKWCQLRPGELRIYRLKNGSLEQTLSLDGLSLSSLKEDKKHPGALRLSSVGPLKDILHFHVPDKIQMGQWIKYFIQALGIVPPVQYESVVDWIPVELYQQFVSNRRRRTESRTKEEGVYDEVCSASVHSKRHSVCLPPRKSSDNNLPPLPNLDLPPLPQEDPPVVDDYYLYDVLPTPGLSRSDTVRSTASDPTDTLRRTKVSASDTMLSSWSAPCTTTPCLRKKVDSNGNRTNTGTLDSSYRLSGLSTQSSASTDDHSAESLPIDMLTPLKNYPSHQSTPTAADVARTRLLRKTSFELIHEDIAVLGHQIARLRHKVTELRRHANSDSALPGDEEEVNTLEAELNAKLSQMERLRGRAQRVPFAAKEAAAAETKGRSMSSSIPSETRVTSSLPRSVSSPWPEESNT